MSLIRRFRDWLTHPNLPDPTEPFRTRRRERVIEAMCQTWDPSYSIGQADTPGDAMVFAKRRLVLRQRMARIYDADLAPEFDALETDMSLRHAAYGTWHLP
jgi:hypothetical protein